jgi:putative DNA primase/helicase
VNKQPSQEDAPGNEQHGPHRVAVKPGESLAERLASIRRIESGQREARAESAAEERGRETNPWLLGTRQGVIDLRTGTLRAGLPDDHMRAIIPTEWKGLDEPAPRFTQFLQELFADREEGEREVLIAFLQRALGYGITGHANAGIFLLFLGDGGYNGKQTFLHVLEHVLGKTVVMVSRHVLFPAEPLSASLSARIHLCNLQGKRIAWASEPDHRTHFDPAQIKLLSSGQAIIARHLYGKAFAFRPSHLLLLLTNHEPEVDPSDSAFWERLCLIPFTMRFVDQPEQPNERQRDPNLGKALETEASGILAWLVRGSLEWRRLGLAIPACVRRNCQEPAKEMFTIKDFVRQCCVLDPQARTRAGVLHRHYQAWAEEHGAMALDSKQFGQEMEQIEQVTREHNKRGNVYVGIRFKTDEK